MFRLYAYVTLTVMAGVASAQNDGSVIEVKNGNLHINLEETGKKVFVSVKGGEEIELFDLAARVQALEDKSDAQATVNEAFEEIRTQVGKNHEQLLDAQESLAIVPQMTACAAESKIFHPEDAECKSPEQVHCPRLSEDEHAQLLVVGSTLINKQSCTFNQHYGGQSCAATCLSGSNVVPGADEDWKNGEVTFDEEAVSAGNGGLTCLNKGLTAFVNEGDVPLRDQYMGTLSEAKTECAKWDECLFLHDWGGKNKAQWRVCQHVRIGPYTSNVIKVHRGSTYTCTATGEWEANFECSFPTCDEPTASRLMITDAAIASGASLQMQRAGIAGTYTSPNGVVSFKCKDGTRPKHVDGETKPVLWSTCIPASGNDSAEWENSYENLICA